MRSLARVAMDAGAIERSLGDHRDRATGCEADVGSQCAEKQSATQRLRAAITQVGSHRCADVRRDRHPPSLPAFGANEHLAGAPVYVIQGKDRDLAGPHAQLRQHHENGIVPPPKSGRSVATVEDCLNLHRGEIGRKARELPSLDGGHAACQRAWVQPFMMQISEK